MYGLAVHIDWVVLARQAENVTARVMEGLGGLSAGNGTVLHHTRMDSPSRVTGLVPGHALVVE
jgi:hypothetical protein